MELTIEQGEHKEQPHHQLSQKQQQQKRTFYSVRKRTRYNEYQTVSYIKDGSFYGFAVFDTQAEAEAYLEEYAKKLALISLKDRLGSHGTILKNDAHSRQNSFKLEVFEEDSLEGLRLGKSNSSLKSKSK